MPAPATRPGIAEWLVERLHDDRPTLVGIDHACSFPHQYLQMHNLPLDWPAFLDDRWTSSAKASTETRPHDPATQAGGDISR